MERKNGLPGRKQQWYLVNFVWQYINDVDLLKYWRCLCYLILIPTKLHNLKEWILWSMKYISTKVTKSTAITINAYFKFQAYCRISLNPPGYITMQILICLNSSYLLYQHWELIMFFGEAMALHSVYCGWGYVAVKTNELVTSFLKFYAKTLPSVLLF